MARPLRIEFAGALYHVMARGDDRAEIYRDDDDRQAFLDCLGRTCERFGWRCWAYCLMGNHYHLLVETLKPTLSRGMRELNGVYTQAFNRRHRRAGHVLQGRYKAILVEKDSYLLQVSRYIVLNPVAARLVVHPERWAWSSYRAMGGKAPAPEWLATSETLALFSSSQPAAARRGYARFVQEGIGGSDLMGEVRNQLYLGSDRFIDRVAGQHASKASGRTEIPRHQRAVKTLSGYARDAGKDRNAAICAAYDSGAYTLKQIGEHFGVHFTMVSKIGRARIKT